MVPKTRDGLNLEKVLAAMQQIAGISLRRGRNHPYIAYIQGNPKVCPIAQSTDVRRMIVPLIKHTSQYCDYSTQQIYQALKTGRWN